MKENTNKPQRMSIYFPLDLLAQVRKSAKEHRRSFNQEVLWIIQQHLQAKQRGEST